MYTIKKGTTELGGNSLWSFCQPRKQRPKYQRQLFDNDIKSEKGEKYLDVGIPIPPAVKKKQVLFFFFFLFIYLLFLKNNNVYLECLAVNSCVVSRNAKNPTLFNKSSTVMNTKHTTIPIVHLFSVNKTNEILCKRKKGKILGNVEHFFSQK
jgi:hypothetical protein